MLRSLASLPNVRRIALLPCAVLLAAGCGSSAVTGNGPDGGVVATGGTGASGGAAGAAGAAVGAGAGAGGAAAGIGGGGAGEGGGGSHSVPNPVGGGPAAVALGAASNPAAAGSYVILAKTGITNVTGSLITGGNLGLSPAAASYVTGF